MQAWVQGLALLRSCCVTLGNLFTSLDLLIFKMRMTLSTLENCDDSMTTKVLSMVPGTDSKKSTHVNIIIPFPCSF